MLIITILFLRFAVVSISLSDACLHMHALAITGFSSVSTFFSFFFFSMNSSRKNLINI